MDSPNHGAGVALFGISCASAKFCVAVGERNSSSTVVETWSGDAWTNAASPKIPGTNALTDVDCLSAQSCWAVGSDKGRSLIEHWNGSIWRLSSGTETNYPLQGISCVTTSFCVTVGQSGNRSVVMTWRGVRWSIAFQKHPLRDVSCTSTNFCEAVGFAGSVGPYAESWNGSHWIRSNFVAPHSSVLNAVSCWSSHGCLTVGANFATDEASVEAWNGKEWSTVPSRQETKSLVLLGVACDKAKVCDAVGQAKGAPFVIKWSGGTWNESASASNAGRGLLDGIAFREGTAIAVGSHQPELRSLIERGPATK